MFVLFSRPSARVVDVIRRNQVQAFADHTLAQGGHIDVIVNNAGVMPLSPLAWRDGHGSVFDLLADDVESTVAGSSPVSGRFHSRQALIEHTVQPIHTRLPTAISLRVKPILAQDDAVVVIWDGTAPAVDGSTYRNSYAWHGVIDVGRVTRVVAFLRCAGAECTAGVRPGSRESEAVREARVQSACGSAVLRYWPHVTPGGCFGWCLATP